MLFLFVLAILLLIAALVALAIKGGKPYAIGFAALGLLLVFISCIRTVGTKEIGVPTTFGKVGTTHYGAGFHLTSPWTSLHQMDGAIQTDDHLKDKCYQVRIANQQTGCAEISLQWRINPIWVDYLYKNYRSFGHLTTQLVDRKLFSAVNEALASYNPLNTVSASTKKNPLPQYQQAVFKIMHQKVTDINGNPLIEVLNVQLPIVHFDTETQNRLNQLQQQVALTRIAQQEHATNVAKANANAALSTKALSTQILVSRCFDTLESLVKTHQTVPAGFSCCPGGSLAGVIAK